MAAYVVLTNSNSSLSKKFRVLLGTAKPRIAGAKSVRRTITGKTDVQIGASWRSWEFTVQILDPDPGGAEYGTVADLLALYSLIDPTATPSDRITFTDFKGDVFTVKFMNHDEVRRLGAGWDDGSPAHVPVVLETV